MTPSELDFETSQATFNLNISEEAGENPDIVAAKHNKAREMSMPYALVRYMDNNSLYPKHDASGLHPAFRKLLANKPDKVGMFKDDLPNLNAFTQAANSDTAGESLNKWSEGVAKSFETQAGINIGAIRSLPPEKQANFMHLANQQLKKEIVLVRLLNQYAPENWQENWSDERVRKFVDTINQDVLVNQGSQPFDMSGVNIDRLRKGGFLDAEWSDVFGVFKLIHELENASKYNADYYNAIDEKSPLEDQVRLFKFLSDYSMDVRGYNLGGKIATGIANLLPFAVELGLTRGAATVTKEAAQMSVREAIKLTMREAAEQGVKGWLKAAGKSLTYIAKGEARRAPLFFGKDVAQTYLELEQKPVYYLGKNGVEQALSEERAGDFADVLVRNMVMGYGERFTEQLGGRNIEFHLMAIDRIGYTCQGEASFECTNPDVIAGFRKYN